MLKERPFRRNAMYIYRGVTHAIPSTSDPVTSGIYRGSKWTSDSKEKNPKPTSGTYRGIKWGN